MAVSKFGDEEAMVLAGGVVGDLVGAFEEF